MTKVKNPKAPVYNSWSIPYIQNYFDYFSGMCFNGIFLVSGMLNMEIWACFKYADIGFSIGLSFCFATAAIDLSIKASGKVIKVTQGGVSSRAIHI